VLSHPLVDIGLRPAEVMARPPRCP
jgi:uncharacterized protein YjiS (DUF1127 family)